MPSTSTLLSRSPLPERFRWSLWSAYVLIPLLAAEVTLVLYVEPYVQPTMDVAARIMGVTGILVAANTILIEILHRLSGVEASTPVRPPLRLDRGAIDAEIERLQARIAELEGLRRQA